MSTHQVERFIERFTQKVVEDGLGVQMRAKRDDYIADIQPTVDKLLRPLLEAGQVQRDRHCGLQGIICAACKAWDVALAAAAHPTGGRHGTAASDL